MGDFKGFSPDAFMLLELNKFNDSRDFYESVKEDIKKLAIVPMRQLASDLSGELYRIDDKMNLVPTKMVSRIRRDTRFSKNKEMYRANVWCMFMRDKHIWNHQPCMWFEFFPDSYSYGVGTFRTDASFLETFRKVLAENQEDFKKAITSIEITGALPFIDSFKKSKPGIEKIADDLKPFYNSRDFYFVYTNSDMSGLIDGSIVTELTYAIRAFEPMYKFMIKVCDEHIKNGE